MASNPLSDFQSALIDRDDQSILDQFYYARPALMLQGNQEAELRRAVADRFGVAMRDVIITGSAKLGFTVVAKEYRPIFSPFGNTSDIDVAIISRSLFTDLWRSSFDYMAQHGDWSDANSFRKFLMRGWLRPDRLPKDDQFPRSREWFDFFRELTASSRFGPYKISGGVYYDEWFWENYASLAFKDCRMAIEAPL